VVGGGEHDVQPLTVTTYDSAYLHMDHLGDRFGLLVFDECHHLPGASYALAARLALAPFRLAAEEKVGNQAAMVSLGRPGAGEQLLGAHGFTGIERMAVPFAMAPAAGSACAPAAAWTSSRVTVPLGPVGGTKARSTPRSLASLRTGGLASTFEPAPGAGAVGADTAGAAFSRAADWP